MRVDHFVKIGSGTRSTVRQAAVAQIVGDNGNSKWTGRQPVTVISFLDTSVFIPLIALESGTSVCRRFWDDADAIAACPLLYIEAAAALAQATRSGQPAELGGRAAVRAGYPRPALGLCRGHRGRPGAR